MVGYNNTAAREGLNWYAPMFLTVGKTTIDINSIVLNDVNEEGMVGWGDVMQIVGPLGNASADYFFYSDPSMDLSGKATGPFWSDDSGNSVNVTLEPGAGFVIDNANGLTYDIEIACPY